jgi:adenylate cyclase
MAEPARVLVVDDDSVNRMMLSYSLEQEGHTVLQAENGRRALALLAAEPVDLVLLDVVMPEMDGYAVLERRKDDPALRDIPFIVISGVDELASVVRCIELGAEDYLTKPFDPVLLRARIGACLEKKRLHDRERAHLATIESQTAELAELNRTLEARVQRQVQEMERLARLRRFLPPQLADVIVTSGDERALASHRREITVVFCDLRGFTPFAETAEPEDVMAVLREYHAALGPLVFRYEGTLQTFTGDGMMVVFNDPLPCPDPAWRAVQMAVAMRAAAAELSARWRRRGHQLDFGVGIAVGYATCGTIGFAGRLDYSAIGTVCNLADRLCKEAGPGQILVSQRVYDAVEPLVDAEPVGELVLKGFARPVATFSVREIKAGMPVSTAAAPPNVGRMKDEG